VRAGQVPHTDVADECLRAESTAGAFSKHRSGSNDETPGVATIQESCRARETAVARSLGSHGRAACEVSGGYAYVPGALDTGTLLDDRTGTRTSIASPAGYYPATMGGPWLLFSCQGVPDLYSLATGAWQPVPPVFGMLLPVWAALEGNNPLALSVTSADRPIRSGSGRIRGFLNDEAAVG
jgi:hypothetical protein